MPNFNSTGPRGKGTMTGVGRGYCALPLSNSEQELGYLKNQEQVLQEQLQQIRARIKGVKTIKEVRHAGI